MSGMPELVQKDDVGAPDGVAPLDENSKVPAEYLPDPAPAEAPLSFEEKNDQFNAVATGTWHVVTLPDAPANKIVMITMENPSFGNRSFGVREVGSVRDRRLNIRTSIHSLLVKTNGSGQIEIYCSHMVLDFYLTAIVHEAS